MYSNCLAALDHSSFDKHILEQLDLVSGIMAIEKMWYVHVLPDQREPTCPTGEKLRESRHEINEQQSISKRDSIRPDGVLPDIIELQGSPEQTLASFIKKNKVDLVCVGLKESDDQDELVGRRLLCITDSDLLFLPPVKKTDFKRLLLPVDLSDHALSLVKKAVELFPDVAIELLYVHFLPAVTVIGPKKRRQLKDAAEIEIEMNFLNFLQKIEGDKSRITFHFTMNDQFNAGHAIHAYARENGADMIMMGRLSQLDKELPFLGSVTQKILNLSRDIPVLVINH